MSGRGVFPSMVALGLVAGVLGGLFGIGGGLIIVPVLALVVGLDQKTATGTSLFSMVWPTAALGVWEYWTRGEARLDWGSMVALGLLGGVLIGAKLTAPLSPAAMKRIYGVFLLVVGTYYLLRTSHATHGPTGLPVHPMGLVAGLAIGVAAGVLGGLFGIGGGLVIVPALALLGGLDQKTAVGTSLFAQVWPVGILGVLEYRRRGEARADLGALIALGLLLGNLVGAKLTKPMDEETMQHLYGGFLLIVGVYYQFTLRRRPRNKQ